MTTATAPATRIVEEGDDVTRDESWCFSGDAGNEALSDRIVPPFRISASGAVREAMGSRHFAALRRTVPGALIGTHGMTFGFHCARRCAAPTSPDATVPDDCNFRFRVDDVDAQTPSNLVEWLAVDPMTKKLYWEVFGADGGSHVESEALP
jgi:hypothetical protein